MTMAVCEKLISIVRPFIECSGPITLAKELRAIFMRPNKN